MGAMSSQLQLFDHVFAVYCPPERAVDPRYSAAIGRRGLFQVAGVVTLDERKHVGEPVLIPRDMRDGLGALFPHRVPLSHLREVELAPPEAGKVRMDERRYEKGGG